MLVEEGHVLPVLDGLDELPAPARAQVIRALNESLTEGDQLILTSRTTEFATAVKSAGDVVTAAAVIAPVALTPPVAATYLRTCLPPEPCHDWEPVLATIDSGSASALAAVTATPLGLWLIRMVYVLPGADPAPLLGPLGRDPAALRRHLLDQLIDALIRARPPVSDGTDPFRPRRAWDPGQARTWLGHLAQALTRNHTRDLAWWSIARYITTSPRRRLLQVMIGLVVGTVTLLVLSVHGVSDQAASVLGLGAGISAGIWAGFVAKRWFQESPGSRRLPIRKLLAVLVRVLVAGLATWTVTLLVAVMVALLVIVMGSEALLEAKGTLAYQFMEVVLWLGFLTGLAAALIVWSKGMERPAVLVSTSTPISVWQADRNLSLARILAAGVMFGLVFFVFDFYAALAFRVDLQGKPQPGLGLADALVQGFASGLTGLLVGGLVGGLVGRHHAWLLYVLVVRTASTIHLPAKLMPFLDDMHRLGLLRTVGPHYQFRHAELQDHLAPAPSPDGDPQQAAGTAPSRRISF